MTASVQCRPTADTESHCGFVREESLPNNPLRLTFILVPFSIWSGKENAAKLSNTGLFLAEQGDIYP